MISPSVATGLSFEATFERPEYCDSTLPSATQRWFGDIEAARHELRFSIRPTWSVGQAKVSAGRAKREREFLAGRRCAAKLLSERGVYRPVGVNADRSPNWPDGIVGSISHSERWTVACVASEGVTRSVGVDTEPIVSPDTRKLIAHDIATAAELGLLQSLALDSESALTLIFSAKESFYKCWYPINNRFLEFLDVAVVGVNESSLRLRLAVPSSHAESELSELSVSYHLTDDDVFTFAILEGDQ